MGASEILVILVVALLFLGPEKLPEAAQKISRGIRDIRKQTRDLQETIENDSEIGGAIRDIKSALRGDEPRRAVPPKPPAKPAPAPVAAAAAAAATPAAAATAETAAAPAPAVPAAEPAGEVDFDAATLIRPAADTVAQGSPSDETPTVVKAQG